MLMRFIFLILLVAVFSSTSAQSAMALTKDLIEQQGKYYHRGEPFTGVGFAKNKKGKFVTEEPFKNGLLHGKRVNYDDNGHVLAREKFKKGRGIYRTYYFNNKIKSLGSIDKNVKMGEWKYYNSKGVLKAREFWSEDIPDQLEWEKFYNIKGGIETELFYKAGLLKKEVYYDEQGKIYKTNEN